MDLIFIFASMWLVLFPPVGIFVFLVICLSCWIRRRFWFKSCAEKAQYTVAFLHPACASGGGGEGVLWTAIAALQNSSFAEKIDKIVIYCDKNSPVISPQDLVDRVHLQFGINVSSENLETYPVSMAKLALRPESMPFLTLAFQAIFSVLLAVEALWKHPPNMLFDTTGLTFSLPVFRWLLGSHCKIVAYVHYPWISANMMSVVANRSATFNNRSIFARSTILTRSKLVYYKFLAWAYAYAGSCADVAMVNSVWTRDHLSEIWTHFPSYNLHVVYPPVNVEPFMKKKPSSGSFTTAVYVAQFRPEKNHKFLLEAFSTFLKSLSDSSVKSRFQLKLIGGCRSQDDKNRMAELKKIADELNISSNISFCVGIPHEELVDALVSAQIAVHPMVDEHFGIAVVEAMAAGLIVVAHKSGGPARDILLPSEESPKQQTGILVPSLDKEVFGKALRLAFVELSDADRQAMTNAAKERAEKKFSSTQFQHGFLMAIESLF